ncbi:hypothetical protein [Parabacteroides pacaensis]|uniref:hypothetical protein n=1 Tax=Parabacteroides pacaensis TaxID=2086575 RepID=UPI000D0E9E1E|nr:hypothetical protein [Parabacteroides pacaensis]
MKKLLLLMLVAFVAMSCEGPTGPQGPPGGAQKVYVGEYTIHDSDWESYLTEDGFVNYTYVFDDKNILEDYYIDGVAVGYIYLVDGQKNELKEPLPYTESYIDGAGKACTAHYTFDFMPGSIAFHIRTDSSRPKTPPTTTFQVVMTW